MTLQPAQPVLNTKKLIPFFVLGGLIILGVIASTIVSQSRVEPTNTSIPVTDQPVDYQANIEPTITPEAKVIVGQTTDNAALTISLDSGSNDFTQAISFGIVLEIDPVISATEVIPSENLTNAKWAYPVTIVEEKNGVTSIRLAGYNIKSSDLNGINVLATVPLSTPVDINDLAIRLLPQDSVAFSKSGTQYQLVLSE